MNPWIVSVVLTALAVSSMVFLILCLYSRDKIAARAARERLAAPSYGTCHRCRRPWKFVEGHTTQFSPIAGCFPLCEKCWHDLKMPQTRWPYYHELIEEWELASGRSYAEEKDAIFNAVMEGK